MVSIKKVASIPVELTRQGTSLLEMAFHKIGDILDQAKHDEGYSAALGISIVVILALNIAKSAPTLPK